MSEHEHVWTHTAPDGTVIPTNACQVEDCTWFRAVQRPRRTRPARNRTAAPRRSHDNGPDSLRDLLRF